MEAPPLVVLIHGAWHGAWCWAALQTELDSRGIPSLAVDLPGHGASIEPFADLAGDAACVTAVLGRAKRRVVLVGHSYGGAVISEASALQNHVVHLVYLTAYVLDIGESVASLTRSMPNSPSALSAAIVIEGAVSTIDPVLAPAAFYGHCDPMVTTANVARLGAQPYVTFTQAATNAAWQQLPSTYVRCTDDGAIPLAHQDVMAGRCRNMESLDSDHSPFSSMPVETAEIIARIARG